jgi:hypothetical protein
MIARDRCPWWRAADLCGVIAGALLLAECGKSATAPASPTAPAPVTPTPATSAFVATFSENPVPFRGNDCSPLTPQGWYTSARLQETGGASFTPSAFVQKLDGSVSALLAESFNSRFGACPGSPFSAGVIPANGAVCATVGVCASTAFHNYQFQITGTDANGHALTFDSPLLQFGAMGQSISIRNFSLPPGFPRPIRPIR